MFLCFISLFVLLHHVIHHTSQGRQKVVVVCCFGQPASLQCSTAVLRKTLVRLRRSYTGIVDMFAWFEYVLAKKVLGVLGSRKRRDLLIVVAAPHSPVSSVSN